MSEEIEQSFYDDDEYRSRRYPDMHGGQQDAAAAPDERDDKKGTDEAHSQHALRKKHLQAVKDIHGDNHPQPTLPVLINMHNTDIEILRTLKDIRTYLEYQIPLGQL